MSTTSNIAPQLRTPSLPRRQSATLIPPAAVKVLVILTLLTTGIFIGMVITNQLIQAQIDVYGEANIAATSVMLDFMDDLLPYLASAMVGSLLLAPLTLAAWTWSRPMPHSVRLTALALGAPALGALALVAVLIIFGAVTVGLGRSSPVTVVAPVTPTPLP